MKKIYSLIIVFCMFYTSLAATEFEKRYYIDAFDDKTDEGYLCSEPIFGTSPNTFGGVTEFRANLCVDEEDVFFIVKRRNGDKYAGDGTAYVKLNNGEIKSFSVKNHSSQFYISDKEQEEFRALLLHENSIRVVIEIDYMDYKFKLGTIDLTNLHTILKEGQE